MTAHTGSVQSPPLNLERTAAAGDALLAAGPHTPATTRSAPGVAVMLMARRAGCAGWGMARFILGPGAVRHAPGLRLCKVMGSGHEGGFGLRPSLDRHALLCVFDTPAQARAFLEEHPVPRDWQAHSREMYRAVLEPYSSRGSWSGHAMLPPGTPASAHDGPLATLTRASIRPLKAWRFWVHAAPSQMDLEHAPGCRLAVGMGEAPLLRQATFSVWDSVQQMEAYAHSGAHQSAVRSAYADGFFSESLFTRFHILWQSGHWKGRHHG